MLILIHKFNSYLTYIVIHIWCKYFFSGTDYPVFTEGSLLQNSQRQISILAPQCRRLVSIVGNSSTCPASTQTQRLIARSVNICINNLLSPLCSLFICARRMVAPQHSSVQMGPSSTNSISSVTGEYWKILHVGESFPPDQVVQHWLRGATGLLQPEPVHIRRTGGGLVALVWLHCVLSYASSNDCPRRCKVNFVTLVWLFSSGCVST